MISPRCIGGICFNCWPQEIWLYNMIYALLVGLKGRV